MQWVMKVAKAIDHVLANNDNFTNEEIQDACLYALHKYGSDYTALGEVMVEIIYQERFSRYTLADCQNKRAAHA